ASPNELPGQVVPALLIGFVLLLIARPVSVALSTVGFKLTWGEKMFASWAGLRGAVPIVLATIPMAHGVEQSVRIFSIVFTIVVVFTLLQGPTLPLAARLCRLEDGEQTRELDVEAAPLEELHADLLEVRIPADSMLSGVEIFELRLPPGAAVTLIVRNGSSFVPEPTTPLQAGDKLLVVTTAAVREAAERRLRAVSRKGRRAGWFGRQGTRPASQARGLWPAASRARPVRRSGYGLSSRDRPPSRYRLGTGRGRIVFRRWVPLAVVQSEC